MIEPRHSLTPVEGYRLFRVVTGELVSYSANYEWTPGENIASCDRAGKSTKRKVWQNDPDGEGLIQTTVTERHGRIPALGCGCGFWFYKTEYACRRTFPALSALPSLPSAGHFGDFGTDPEHGTVMGKVEGRGRVIVGADGFRTEFAKVTALVTAFPEHFGTVMGKYEVPVLAPRTKLEEGISEGLLVGYDPAARPLVMKTAWLGDPTENADGDFLVEPGSPAHARLLRIVPGAWVQFHFTHEDGGRWVLAVREIAEGKAPTS